MILLRIHTKPEKLQIVIPAVFNTLSLARPTSNGDITKQNSKRTRQ
jgi:hypothetical protein